MMTVQMTLQEQLVKQVDQLAHKLHTSRSAFTREALKLAIKKYKMLELEKKHKEGYHQHPVSKGEFDMFEEESAWGDS